ncbi:apolipoprotein N-acyltransferase [Anaplasmataceae bacterium AB001_6]|nr:apolipoprotein N-acyltransferase [Anaplasmataceae bacterium AB001_6]
MGTIFGTGYFLVCMHWILIPLIENDFTFFIIMMPIAYIILGLSYGIPTLIFRLQGQNSPLLFALIFTITEYIRSTQFINMPWGYIGYALLKTDNLAQINSIVGINGANFLTYFIAVIPGYLAHLQSKKYNHLIVSYIIVIIAIVNLSQYLSFIPPTEFTDHTTRIVQPNLRCKYSDYQCALQSTKKSTELSIQNKISKIDLLIWPEGSMNILIKNNYDIFKYRKDINNIIDNYLIAGAFKKQNEKIYSSMMMVDKKGKIVDLYNKIHPVPFGEKIPFTKIYKKFVKNDKTVTGAIDAGTDKTKAFDTKFPLKIKPSICFDIAFQDYVPQDTDLIVNIANQSWYNNNQMIRKQYIELAKVRAIENRLPILNSTVNGESFIIDAYGIVMKMLDIEKNGYIDHLIPKKPKKRSIYYKYGKYFELFLIFITIFLVSKNFLKNKK